MGGLEGLVLSNLVVVGGSLGIRFLGPDVGGRGGIEKEGGYPPPFQFIPAPPPLQGHTEHKPDPHMLISAWWSLTEEGAHGSAVTNPLPKNMNRAQTKSHPKIRATPK